MRRSVVAIIAMMLFPLVACSGLNSRTREGTVVETKTIRSKREPNLLIAMDGTECVVSRARWEKATAGDPYLCAWRRGA